MSIRLVISDDNDFSEHEKGKNNFINRHENNSTYMQLSHCFEHKPMPHVVYVLLKPIHRNIVLFPISKFLFRHHLEAF